MAPVRTLRPASQRETVLSPRCSSFADSAWVSLCCQPPSSPQPHPHPLPHPHDDPTPVHTPTQALQECHGPFAVYLP